MKFEVIVQLKQNVFNAEEKEVFSSIVSNGNKVNNIKIAKLFTVDIENSVQNPEDVVKNIAQTTLANTVIETFSIKKIND
jgi:phosphoribosylformylglycinamidine synthase PurS subunit